MLKQVCWAIILTLFPLAANAATSTPSPDRIRLGQRELQLSNELTRAQDYVDVKHASVRPSCEMVEPPVALATPDPLFVPANHGQKVAISFIIGTDGRVHSPLILESAGLPGDRRVIQTVRGWRYRPATCNGVPTETEGKIEFSIR
ncbi:MAG TPA: TonB family protein [Candidatus Sulfotelmatobacter sp.]|nr:TonB family protein [Candidatus Sulfotelmatobacter sp.]